jgi:peptide/nickel transport system substrate-binding protein
VRQALQMSIDRWGGSDALGKISIIKTVGGPLRPGSANALSNDELAKLPGFGRDIEKSRAEAKKMLEEAGVKDLKFKLINRNVNQPFTPAGVYVVDQFRRIGVTAEHTQLDVSQQKKALLNGEFQVGIDAFCTDNDDPRPLVLQYLSKSKSPRNTTHGENPEIDTLYESLQGKPQNEQKKILAELQKKVIEGAFDVPVLWYSRIVAHASNMKGWKISPSHFVGQDLANIWLQ